VDLLSVIRRWHGRDKLSMREIARRTGLSRHTIRKYLANGVTEPKYPLRKRVSKLDPFAETLSVWLKRAGGDREMANILALVLQHDEQLVEQAVREAIKSGVVTKTHILNCLGRLLDTPRPAMLEPPPALAINEEPIANTERYDRLRGARYDD